MSSVPLQQVARDEPTHHWSGDATWREVAELRERLFDQLEMPGGSGLLLDVRDVTAIDTSGVVLLVGANFRATAAGRTLTLLDDDGPVSLALARRHMLAGFTVTRRVCVPGHGDEQRLVESRLSTTSLAVPGGTS